MTLEIITFGCRLNHYESEVIRQEAEKSGINKDSTTYIINTCAVTAEAVRQAKQSIRKIKKNHPNSNVIVTGCAAQIDGKIFSEMTDVDLVVGNEEKLHAVTYQNFSQTLLSDYEKLRVNDIMSVKETACHLITSFGKRVKAFVQVQNGCDHRCTFCVIPYGRGPSRSVPMGHVIEQIKILLGNGYKEIILTGVDLTSYGSDLPGSPSLGTLVEAIFKHVPCLSRLRLSSIDSIEIDPILKQLILFEKRLMPHIHLSQQSGDNLILKRMKRRHLREQSIEICQELLSGRPELTFGADLIVGFPTETERMFENTLSLVKECQLTYLHVFPYSPRGLTPAAKMPQLPKKIIQERSKFLRDFGKDVYLKHLNKQIGSLQQVLVEKDYFGRAENYTPVKLSFPNASGEIVSCRISGNDAHQLLETTSEVSL